VQGVCKMDGVSCVLCANCLVKGNWAQSFWNWCILQNKRLKSNTSWRQDWPQPNLERSSFPFEKNVLYSVRTSGNHIISSSQACWIVCRCAVLAAVRVHLWIRVYLCASDKYCVFVGVSTNWTNGRVHVGGIMFLKIGFRKIMFLRDPMKHFLRIVRNVSYES